MIFATKYLNPGSCPAITKLLKLSLKLLDYTGISIDEITMVIVIDDDGPGIPASMREEVFRPFFRLDEARNLDETGTGLGLSIARDIARNHGGDINLHKSAMGGLRAIVKLPT